MGVTLQLLTEVVCYLNIFIFIAIILLDTIYVYNVKSSHVVVVIEAEIDIRMREEFSKVCFETLLQFSFSNKVSTPQEGYISRMALSVLLRRAQDVLRRYVEDERLSGRCPLPR